MNSIKDVLTRHAGLIDGLFESIESSLEALISSIREIAEIPAPTFHEEKRSEFLAGAFSDAGLNDIQVLARGGIIGFTKSDKEKDSLLLASHIDHVFPFGTDLKTTVKDGVLHGPGTGDNATNVAALLLLARLLRENGIELERNLALCGTVREEGNGNLDGIAEVFEFMVERLGSVIAVDGGLSSVVNRSLAIRRYILEVSCHGGHSWGHFGTPSAIHEAARIIEKIVRLKVPEKPKTTYNVGTITGGSAVNAIAESCTAEIDLRSLSPETLEKLEGDFLAIAGEAGHEDVRVETRLIGDRPAAVLEESHPLVVAAVESARHFGFEPGLGASSTDAAYTLARGVPSISFGIYRGGGGHTLREFVEVDSLVAGMKRLALTVLALAGIKE